MSQMGFVVSNQYKEPFMCFGLENWSKLMERATHPQEEQGVTPPADFTIKIASIHRQLQLCLLILWLSKVMWLPDKGVCVDVGLYPSNSSIHFLVTVKPWEWGAGVDCSAGIMAYINPVGPATAEAPKSEGNGHCDSEMPRQHAKMLDTLKSLQIKWKKESSFRRKTFRIQC